MRCKQTVLFCKCGYSNIISREKKAEILNRLKRLDGELECVEDLCGLSAEKNSRLAELARRDNLVVVACYPRAVRWLFEAAGSPLPEEGVMLLNMRDTCADGILARIGAEDRSDAAPGTEPSAESSGEPLREPSRESPEASVAESSEAPAKCSACSEGEPAGAGKRGDWIPWFPVIDYSLCIGCRQCMDFCLFDVFAPAEENKVEVRNPRNCKTNCPACARICPVGAILFPKYTAGILSGAEVTPENQSGEAVQVDLKKMLEGDIYKQLHKREQSACRPFSTDEAEEKARGERRQCSCMGDLQKQLDIPQDVMDQLSSDEIAGGVFKKKKEKGNKSDGAGSSSGGCSCS